MVRFFFYFHFKEMCIATSANYEERRDFNNNYELI